MKKYLFALFIIPVLFLVSAHLVSAQNRGLLSNVTPGGDASWSVGTTQNITWNNTSPPSCPMPSTLGLFTLDANGLPNYHVDSYGRYVPDYSGVVAGPTSGTISLLPETVAMRYKVVVRCYSITMGESGSSVSAGVVTVINPSFPPLILVSPTTPATYPAGVPASNVGISVRVASVAASLLPAGTPVTIKLIKKSDQSVIWQKAASLTDVGATSPYLSDGINPEVVATIPAGTYFFRDEMQGTDGQNYSVNSADLIFTAPTGSITITAPGTGDVWTAGTSRDITWTSSGIPAGNSIYARLTGPTSGSNVNIGPNDGSHTVTVPNTPGQWQYTLWDGSAAMDTGDDFTIVLPPPGPDLVISAPATLTVAPNSIPAGEPTDVAVSGWTVKNQGDVASGGFRIGYYLSSDATVDANDTVLISGWRASLVPGATQTSPSRTFTVNKPVGTYYIIIMVDDTRVVTESDETNNSKSAVLTVAGAPTVSITINTPKSDGTTVWQVNTANNIEFVAENMPTGVAATIKRYASSDTTASTPLGTAVCSATCLAAGSFSVTITTTGSYYYIIRNNYASAQSGNFTVTTDGGGNPDPGTGWQNPALPPPECETDPASPNYRVGCLPPINVSFAPQLKNGSLGIGGNFLVGGWSPYTLPANLNLGVFGNIGAKKYCDEKGEHCTDAPPDSWPGGGDGGAPDNYSCPDGQSIGTIVNGSVTRCEPDDVGAGSFDTSGFSNGLCGDSSSGKVYWSGTRLVCATDQIGAAGTGDITSVQSSGAKSGLTVKSSAIVDGDAVGGTALAGDAYASLRRDCANGKILKWKPTGAGLEGWECADDDKSSATGGKTYSADGTSLTSVDTASNREFSVKDYGITTTFKADGTVNSSKIAFGTIATPLIATDAVTNAKIADNAVDTAEIVNRAVDNGKLGLTLTDRSCSVGENGTNTCGPWTHSFCVARSILPVADINASGIPNCGVYYGTGDPVRTWKIKVIGKLDGNIFVNTTYECHATCF